MHSIQSDVYAPGVLLYQMLIGDLTSEMPADWSAQLDDALPIEDIGFATATNLSERLETVSELADRLRRLEQRRTQREEDQAKERLANQAVACPRDKVNQQAQPVVSGFTLT